MSDHGAVMDAANAQQLTVHGVRVTVSGSRNDFATVTITDKRHPFQGWSTEYAWSAIERAIDTNGLQ